ncbi:MAG: ParB/RepB/Spo0J family partition protein [Bacteroidaceae bacterium]|nr:ParB/RepB/Spo0J family partition protein [Bacteroidaceae bacterium]
MAIRKKYQGQALGRGLDALLNTGTEVQTAGSSNICEISIENIHPNPNQPRRDFDDDSLQELANSIRQIGIIQPITLRDMGDGSYTIIAGERRWRASMRAGLTHIPAYIRTVDDENMMEMALVENIQRQDLTALEIALAYQHLMEQYDLTQEQLSDKVGKNRATVANYLRLLKLPAPIQMALKNKEIDMGHARALLALNDPTVQLEVFREFKKEKLSVRKIEEMVKELSRGGSVKNKEGKRIRQKGSNLSSEYGALRNSLSKFFQTKVQLTCAETGKGKITIPFANEEELERIIAIIDKLRN